MANLLNKLAASLMGLNVLYLAKWPLSRLYMDLGGAAFISATAARVQKKEKFTKRRIPALNKRLAVRYKLASGAAISLYVSNCPRNTS